MLTKFYFHFILFEAISYIFIPCLKFEHLENVTMTNI